MAQWVANSHWVSENHPATINGISGKLAEGTFKRYTYFFLQPHIASGRNRKSHGSPTKNGKSEAPNAFLKVLWAELRWFLMNLMQFWGGLFHSTIYPRNLNLMPHWTDPEKTWVSNSSIATYEYRLVRWDSVQTSIFEGFYLSKGWRTYRVGGFNPFEKYARQNGNLPQFSGWK